MNGMNPEPKRTLPGEDADGPGSGTARVRNLLALALESSPGPGNWTEPEISSLRDAIPGYMLLERIGRGATGVVYLPGGAGFRGGCGRRGGRGHQDFSGAAGAGSGV